MKCECKKYEGYTTVACCNKCKLPLPTEPWSFEIPERKNSQVDAMVSLRHNEIVEKIRTTIVVAHNDSNKTWGFEPGSIHELASWIEGEIHNAKLDSMNEMPHIVKIEVG